MRSSRVKGISCLVDTDVAIDFLRRREYAQKLLENWAEEGLLAISTLTHLEIYQGMETGEEGAIGRANRTTRFVWIQTVMVSER